jgi:hypothetical protein
MAISISEGIDAYCQDKNINTWEDFVEAIATQQENADGKGVTKKAWTGTFIDCEGRKWEKAEYAFGMTGWANDFTGGSFGLEGLSMGLTGIDLSGTGMEIGGGIFSLTGCVIKDEGNGLTLFQSPTSSSSP